MLQFLKVTNLALLKEAIIECESGFTVVTGETGAGKSIFLGALSLLSGSRASKSSIRSGTEACEVEASLWFKDSARINAKLEGMGLPACEEGLLLLKRSLHVSKPSRISINGSLATLGNLQEIGSLWIDFHGPGEPQRLLHSECQLELIDLYAELQEDAAAYEAAYAEWRETLAEINRLRNATRLSPDQIEFMRMQLQQFERLELEEEAIAQLEQDFNRVSGSQELLALCSELASGLGGDDGILDTMSAMLRKAQEAAELDPSLGELQSRLNAMAVELQELASDYEQVGSSLHFEPEFAAEVEERMAAWQELRRKHGRSLRDVIDARESMRKRLEEQGDVEGALQRLLKKADSQEAKLKRQAQELTRERKKAGSSLCRKAETMLLDLGFKKGRCDIRFIEQKQLRSFGDAMPELLFSPNVGEPLQPLSKIASSGELARVMLALKTILADVDDVPVLVFDEVDANVGGEIGRIVGEKMKRIGESHQVICITHLPQVAALGQDHFLVEKDQSGARATVSITRLQRGSEERVLELARMLGDRNATSARSHAKELLHA